jgi:hypothetical protein
LCGSKIVLAQISAKPFVGCPFGPAPFVVLAYGAKEPKAPADEPKGRKRRAEMMPFSNYQLYKAERLATETERRQADVRAGELVAAVEGLRSSFTGSAKAALIILRSGARRRVTAPAES